MAELRYYFFAFREDSAFVLTGPFEMEKNKIVIFNATLKGHNVSSDSRTSNNSIGGCVASSWDELISKYQLQLWIYRCSVNVSR